MRTTSEKKEKKVCSILLGFIIPLKHKNTANLYMFEPDVFHEQSPEQRRA